jgi:hypothetical protein
LYRFSKGIMTEKQSINGREIWFKIDPHPVQRANPNIIPTEYFTATYYLQEPGPDTNGETIKEQDGDVKLFESPVAALSFARKRMEAML